MGSGGVTAWRSRPRIAAVVLSMLVVAAIVVLIAVLPATRRYIGVAPPRQHSTALGPQSELAGHEVLGVAHNAGNSSRTARAALRHGADVIEIDVIRARGRLVAGRAHEWQWLADRLFHGPTLAQAWSYSSAAPVLKLDLQQTSPAVLDDLVRFLVPRVSGREVLVSSRDPQALAYLRARLPDGVGLLRSVPFADTAERLRSEPSSTSGLRGLTVFQGLVDASLVQWAHARGLLVLAWTVDDGGRAADLARLGVDGITTANLALLDALAETGGA